MKVKDVVYGEFEIKEPVLQKLINSKPLQRLKHVNQAGTQLVFPNLKATRYEHCVGVMLFLKIKGASLEEQIAGLLHDVPHTAFSHAVDFVYYKGRQQNYHEKFLEKIIMESEIPQILKTHGLSVKRLLDEENFPLLEKPLPKLCADRIDYTLREVAEQKIVSRKIIKIYLEAIVIFNNEFAVNNKKQALDFALRYMDLSENSWISPRTLASFILFAETVREAFREKILKEEDLFKTDDFVLKILKKSQSPAIKKLLNLQSAKLIVREDNNNFDFHVKGKVRFIDPPVIVGQKVKKLSDIDKKFKEKLKEFKKRLNGGRYLKITGYQ